MNTKKMKPILFRFISTFFIFNLLISWTVFASEQKKSQPLADWQTGPSLPYKVQEIYPVYFQGHIVVAGGLSPDVDDNAIGVSDRVVAFNLATKNWSEAASLPEPRHHPMLVVVGDRLLSFGGFTVDDGGAWHNSTDVLELVTDKDAEGDLLLNGKWQKISQMPTPLAETLSAVHEGIVHLVSGRTPSNADQNSQWNDQTDVNIHFTFDPITLDWSEANSVPTARNSACSVQHKGYMYTIAGRTVAGGNLATHEAYNFSQNTWKKLAPLPDAQGGLACATVNNRIYVFGGEYFNNGGGVYSDVWEYRIASDSWSSVTKMPKPRHGLGALTINDRIYVIAGALQAGGNQTSDVMSMFVPKN